MKELTPELLADIKTWNEPQSVAFALTLWGDAASGKKPAPMFGVIMAALGEQCPRCANMLPETLMKYEVRDEDKK